MTAIHYYGTGRRKTAVARVYLTPGSGKITVNDQPVDSYFPIKRLQENAVAPLELTNNTSVFDIMAKIRGGGISAQSDALRHGISRALVVSSAEYREKLKRAGFLTRDPREKERKKYGQPGARKRFQYSKR